MENGQKLVENISKMSAMGSVIKQTSSNLTDVSEMKQYGNVQNCVVCHNSETSGFNIFSFSVNNSFTELMIYDRFVHLGALPTG